MQSLFGQSKELLRVKAIACSRSRAADIDDNQIVLFMLFAQVEPAICMYDVQVSSLPFCYCGAIEMSQSQSKNRSFQLQIVNLTIRITRQLRCEST